MLRNARLNKIRHLVMVPVYFLTIVFGRLGLVLYMILRALKARSWFADNGGR
jgi:hypothetical protein